MFKFIQTAIDYVVAKVTAAYQAVVNFFFGKEEEKKEEATFTPTSKKTESFKTKIGLISANVNLGITEFTKAQAEEAMVLVEEYVGDSDDKVILAFALFWVFNTFGARNTEGLGFDEAMKYSVHTAACLAMKERFNAIVERYNNAEVKETTYELGVLTSASVFLNLKDVSEVVPFLKGAKK